MSHQKGRDVVDSEPQLSSNTPQQNHNHLQGGGGGSRGPVEVRPGTYNAVKYFMDNENRGHAVIINNKKFQPHLRLPDRAGSDVDASAIYQRFQELGFETDLLNDVTNKEIKAKLEECADDHEFNNKADCFACCILTHGGSDDILYAVDGEMKLSDYLEPFLATNCRSLVQKPKLFIIQACRGTTLSRGQEALDYNVSDAAGEYSQYNQKLNDQPERFRVPDEADFLFVHSSFEGKQSIRNTNRGSPFIASLSEEISKLTEETDIYHLLTRVNKSFLKYRSDNPQIAMLCQMPCFTSTLTKSMCIGLKD